MPSPAGSTGWPSPATRSIIADFKTNRDVPASPEDVSLRHRAQLAIYRALLAPLYPDHAFRCVLIYTEGPAVLTLPRGDAGQAALWSSRQSEIPDIENDAFHHHIMHNRSKNADFETREQPMATVKVDTSNFQDEVLNAAEPVIVDFWAEWCGPCKMIAPSLEEISERDWPAR